MYTVNTVSGGCMAEEEVTAPAVQAAALTASHTKEAAAGARRNSSCARAECQAEELQTSNTGARSGSSINEEIEPGGHWTKGGLPGHPPGR